MIDGDRKNISKIEIDCIVRNAKLIDKYKKEIMNGKQKDMDRPQYSYVFEAFTLKYLSKTKTKMQFRKRTGFHKNTTFKKFLYGEYADITKIDSRIILRVCLGFLMTKQECYDFFYICGQNLWLKEEDCIERMIIDDLCNLENMEQVEKLTDVEKQDLAYENIHEASLRYRDKKLRGIYVNCDEEEKDADEIYLEY